MRIAETRYGMDASTSDTVLEASTDFVSWVHTCELRDISEISDRWTQGDVSYGA